MPNQNPSHCPECGADLSAMDFGKPWCSACEWNLAVYDPQILPPRGWLWLERWAHGSASRHDARLLADYSRTPPDSSNRSAVLASLVAISAVLTCVALACVVLGVILVLRDFPSGWILPGLGLILLGYVFRPRFGRGPRRKHQLRREQAPVFFSLLDQIATAAGTSVPDSVVLAAEFNASMQRYGLRGRHTLSIGIPFWLVLSAPMRVALVAHELGHLVNRDPSRGRLVAPALTTVGRLASATGAELTLGRVFDADRERGLGRLVVESVLWVISRPFLLLSLGLAALALRDHQRAEIRADAVSVRVAGSEATTGLLDRLTVMDTIETTVSHSAVTTPPAGWAELAARLHRMAEMTKCRQLTQRATSLWSSHPPSGVRARLVESWPQQDPAVSLPDDQWTEIDRELTPWYAAAHKSLLGHRDYHPTHRPPTPKPATPELEELPPVR